MAFASNRQDFVLTESTTQVLQLKHIASAHLRYRQKEVQGLFAHVIAWIHSSLAWFEAEWDLKWEER